MELEDIVNEEMLTTEDVNDMLEHTDKGRTKQTIRNCVTVLQKDPVLKKAIKRNELSGRMDIVKEVPWERRNNSPTVTDTDENNLKMYLEENYELTSERVIKAGVDIVSNENKYHPIRDYLESLVWDGIPRIENMLPHFLGAEKSNYTVGVMKMHMVAAISRIYEPGIKYDIMLCLVGSQGAGKSTFFLNINGVLKSHHGEIYYRGEKITKKNLNNLRKNVGIVFQDADNQIIASTVMAEVSFGPMNLKLPREEVISRVDKALEYMNISGFKDRPPHYLSGGEKKRVSIADIIAMESEVIIFDEPTAALDPLNAAMLEEVLQKMGDEGRTMLISTHDVDFAYRWAERVIVFCHGKIIADDTPLAVFKQEDILKQANLKHPMMFDVYDILKEKGIVPKGDVYPKNIAEFQAMVKGL